MNTSKTNLIIYRRGNELVRFNLHEGEETIWATQAQIAEIFGVTPQSITIHLKRIYESRELLEKSTCKESLQVQIEGNRKITRKLKTYNLDAIISIGYRINSLKATDFRIWATSVLKEYTLKGIAINTNRLEQLNKALEIVERSDITEVSGVANLIKNYISALTTLEKYDQNTLDNPKGVKESWKLTYEVAREYLNKVQEIGNFNDSFAKERDKHFHGIVRGIYQTFDGKELYYSLEDKAANLLYQVVKDHPFVDGNKRSAAALFVYFLSQNKRLKDMNNNALAAMVLMVALSGVKEKDQMILLIKNFLQ